MGIFKKLFGGNEERTAPDGIEVAPVPEMSENLIRLLLRGESVSKETALNIPAIAGAVNLISNLAASVTYKLYSYDSEGRLVEQKDDRVQKLNKDTGDMLNGYEMKKAFIRDYLLTGNGYIYINRVLNKVQSLHYVDEVNVSVCKSPDPIFKKAIYMVTGKQYLPLDFITITRNSTDGVTGHGLLDENTLAIRALSNMLKTISTNAQTGGLKRGFLETEKPIAQPLLEELRTNFNKMYQSEGIPVLNNGIHFNPITESSTEMQLQSFYDGISDDVSEILQIPKVIKEGTAKDEEFRNWFKICIIPILDEITAALNESLLTESEKENYFWLADTSALENGDLKSKFEAYKVALDSNMLQLDEVREKLGEPPLGFNFIKIGLDSVLVDTENNVVYTPNTNITQSMDDLNRQMGKGSESAGDDES